MSSRPIVSLIFVGLILSIIALVFIRTFGNTGMLAGGSGTIFLYVLWPIISMLALFISLKLLPHVSPLGAATVLTAATLAIDSIAVRWAPELYGRLPEDAEVFCQFCGDDMVIGGAAFIMWGAASTLIIGLIWQSRRDRAEHTQEQQT